MKKLGLILDKKTRKLFLLPKSVKELTSAGIVVNIPAGYGKNLNIVDSEYLKAGAKILKNNKEVITFSDIICKSNAFQSSEIKQMENKIAITMANYLVNVEMLYNLLKNNVKSYAWYALSDGKEYTFLPKFEKIKGRHAAMQVLWGLANKGVGITSANVDDIEHAKVMVVNETFGAYEAICTLLANNCDVTLIDNDLNHCKALINGPEIKKLQNIFGTKVEVADAKFETLIKLCSQHNGLIYTLTDPFSKTKVRITKEMAKAMPAGSILVDASCENGYGFNFQKNFAPENVEFQKLDHVAFVATKDMTDLYPMSTSTIISNVSAKLLKDLCNDKTDAFASILVTKDGKCINEDIRKQLRLF